MASSTLWSRRSCVVNSQTIASSSFMESGFLPSPSAVMIAGSRPAFSASGACAYHSYCEPQCCAVMMIAISLRRLSSEVLKQIFADLLQPVGELGTAQPGVERAAQALARSGHD